MNLIWAWLTDPAHWSGEDGVPHRVLQHLGYALLSVAIALVLAVPLGLWVGHTGRGRWVVSFANSLRAVPTLGLLFAVALWLGPRIRGELAFLLPSVLVLVLLAVPPLLAGAYAGVQAVDPAARDAARGVGMSGGQVLTQVELPCALPLLLSGVRSAVLQVVATATIAAYLGLGGLGRYLFDGIQTADFGMAGAGAVLVALLAVLLEAVLALGQRLTVSPGLRADGIRRRGGRSAGNVGTTRKDPARPEVDQPTSA